MYVLINIVERDQHLDYKIEVEILQYRFNYTGCVPITERDK